MVDGTGSFIILELCFWMTLFMAKGEMLRPKKIILLFPEMWVTKKIFTRAAAKKMFYQFN